MSALRNALEALERPADVASAVVYLCDAWFVTGEPLHVNGDEPMR
ncbi:hypothetical protein [Natrialba sp. PRR66]|nr:hypothetical protein [Natrialba sp. PRR66]